MVSLARLTTCLVIAVTASAAAQRPDSLTAELRETFREVTRVHERPDGRVMILDAHGMQVYLADFSSGDVFRIGRQGMADGQYLWPSRLFPLPGDTTLVWDAIEGKIHVFTEIPGAFEARGTLPGSRISTPTGGKFSPITSDALGRLYARASRGDSAALLRLDRASSRIDTVAVFAANFQRSSTVFPVNVRWVVSSSGAVAVVYPEPYRVDFFVPGSPVVRGAPISFVPTTVTPTVRSNWLQVLHRPRPAWAALGGGQYGFIDQTESDVDYASWPPVLPPVLYNAFVGFTSDGSLLIERLALPAMPTEYDLVDARGQLADRFQIAAGSQIVGTGRQAVYVSVRQPDGRLRLQRFSVRPR